jgi:uncharacterized protein with von Willebrand factor type A (vWA) domain
MMRKQTYLKRKVSRLKREIAQIDESFYELDKGGDLAQHASMLERKRDDVIRGAVLQLHTSIEELITSMIMCLILGVPTDKRSKVMSRPRGKAVRKLMMSAEGLGFDQKLDLAVALRMVSDKRRKRLAILNTLRNKCGHHWVLKGVVRKGRRPRQMKPPLLLYEGRDLHQVATFKEFLSECGPLYARMFVQHLDYYDKL